MDPNNDSVTESLYKQNLELSVKNKTLSLLRQLYQISISSLDQNLLAWKIVEIVRGKLELELVGVLSLKPDTGDLIPLRFSLSDRLKAAEESFHLLLEDAKIPNAKAILFFQKVFESQQNHTENINDVWAGLIPPEVLGRLSEASHIKTVSAYPLIIDHSMTGVFLICLNRTFDKLSQYERESLESISEVTAIALDRARLYEELKVANVKLTELDQLKSEFLSLATHQIRTPLTAIKGYSSMILEGDYGQVSTEIREPVDIIYKSCQNLINIVGDFLNISRIEQGRMAYDKTDFDLSELVKEVVNELMPNIQNAHLTIENKVDGGGPFKVNADRGKIKQVISNIVDNSVKYTVKGGIEVTTLRADDTIKINVTDTGVGIDPTEIGKLFEKFSRTKDANKTSVTGTGLGLYIARKMTEAHGGDIKVTSPGVGKGTTFTIELPALK